MQEYLAVVLNNNQGIFGNADPSICPSVSDAQNFEDAPIRRAKVVPTSLACALDRPDKLDPRCLHRRASRVDIVDPKRNHRPTGKERVEFLFGAIKFHLSDI
jgi:hypothetical protein